MNIVLANNNPILIHSQNRIADIYESVIITKKEELNLKNLEEIKPTFVFFLHWSWIISKEIFSKFNCIVFHMTDLPFGRGGSPLQNLILRGYKDTKMCAIKVDDGLDTGAVYLRKELSLQGRAQDIFILAGKIIEEMIHEIVNNNIKPVQQTGKVVEFKRRKPEQSLITDSISDLTSMHDFIRMLDADNYPHAFIEIGKFRFEFTSSSILNKDCLTANVRIITK